MSTQIKEKCKHKKYFISTLAGAPLVCKSCGKYKYRIATEEKIFKIVQEAVASQLEEVADFCKGMQEEIVVEEERRGYDRREHAYIDKCYIITALDKVLSYLKGES